MACGCGQSRTAKFSYIYTDATGQQRSFNTDIEARAAQVRAGGGGSIRQVPK